MNRISTPLCLALCLAMLAGCPSRPPSAPTGSAQLTVSVPQGLGASVSRVTVTASAEDFSPVSAELHSIDGVWGGTLDNLPAGSQRTFLAKAFDASGTPLLEGSASGVTITEEEMSLVAITLQRVEQPSGSQNAPPVIDSLVAPSTSVPLGGSLSLVATAHDPNPGDTLSYAWTATAGSFSSTTAASTVWTAPVSTVPQTVTVTVTDSHGASASASLTLTVTPSATRGSAQVTVSFNSFPQVSSVLATVSRLDLYQATSVSASATDGDGDSLTYAWTTTCPGSFQRASSSTTNFTPYARPTAACDNCNLTVTVSDGRGGKSTGSVNLCVIAASEARHFPPTLLTASRSGDMTKASSVFTFEVVASDPQGSWLSFSWAANSGYLEYPSYANGIGRVGWRAPACFRPSQPPLIFATVTNGSDLTVTQRFEMRDLPVRTCASEWSPTDAMTGERVHHAMAALPSGKVLVSGGYRWSRNINTAEVYDSATGIWSTTSPMASSRYHHTATPLPNGKVLVSGGRNELSSFATAEVYDPATGTWSATGSMVSPRHAHTATPLPGGKVLIAGGQRDYSSLTTTEVYDPATGTWRETGSLSSPRLEHTATPLPDGKVLLVGGQASGARLATVEVYDPATSTWRAAASLASPRHRHTATLLPNGKVLVVGGFGSGGQLATAEVYDPASDSWSTTSPMASPRPEHTATLLPNGKVLVAGGASFPSSEVYDPASGAWSASVYMSTSRSEHTATPLPDGTVLVAGGSSSGSSLTAAELYVP